VTGNIPKSTLDVRWMEVNAPGGKVGFWYDYAFSKGVLLADGRRLQSAGGHGFGFEHKRTEFLGGFHQFNAQYGTGAASNLVATAQVPSLSWREARTVLITDQALLQVNERFAFQPSFVAYWNRPGEPGVGYSRWLSVGGMPVWYFNRWFGVALGAGADHVVSGATRQAGWVRKFTFAPQIATAPEFFARPVLRGFVTWANWSQSLKGQVGGPAYVNRTNGLSAGLQVESWW
jgi:maltoporin